MTTTTTEATTQLTPTNPADAPTPGEPTTSPTTPSQAETTEPTIGTDSAQQPAQSSQDAAQDEGQPGGARGEAARYRTRLRAAEGERDGLRAELSTVRGRLEAAQRREVERAVGDVLAVPGDLLEFGGHELTEFLRVDGSVDDERVRGAVAVLVGTRPGLAKVARPTLPPNHGAGYRGPSTAAAPTWGDVFRR